MDTAYESDVADRSELSLALLDSRVELRLNATFARFDQRVTSLEAKIDLRAAQFELALEKALHHQTRLFLLGWGVLLASNVALWFR